MASTLPYPHSPLDPLPIHETHPSIVLQHPEKREGPDDQQRRRPRRLARLQQRVHPPVVVGVHVANPQEAQLQNAPEGVCGTVPPFKLAHGIPEGCGLGM